MSSPEDPDASDPGASSFEPDPTPDPSFSSDPIPDPDGVDASGEPDKATRFLAFLIDGLIAGGLSALPLIGGLVGAAYFVLRDGLDVDFMPGRSLGKQVLDIDVVRLDGRPMDLETSLRRNWMWGLGPVAAIAAAFPIFGGFFRGLVSLFGLVVGLYEVYRVLTDSEGRRWGDDLAQTQVVA